MDETGWQDIETAPKDGTPVLAWEKDEQYGLLASYFVAWWYSGSWYRGGDDCDLYVNPTHWQPLPPPPTPSIDGDRG